MIRLSTIGIWILRLLAAIILLQTLYFKFTGATESDLHFLKAGDGAMGQNRNGRVGADSGCSSSYSRNNNIWGLTRCCINGRRHFFSPY